MMDMSRRVDAYVAQNGQGEKLTPRQRRRIQHKINHALAPFGRRIA